MNFPLKYCQQQALDGLKGYCLDRVLLTEIPSGHMSHSGVAAGIYPAPMSEEDKKWWTNFNLESLCRELPSEEALQYDWDGLRAKLEEEGSLTEKNFLSYRRADGAMDAVEISKDPCVKLPTP